MISRVLLSLILPLMMRNSENVGLLICCPVVRTFPSPTRTRPNMLSKFCALVMDFNKLVLTMSQVGYGMEDQEAY